MAKVKSIIVPDMDVCMFCGRPREAVHHVFGGPDRKKSERYHLVVPLCNDHHNMTDESVHFDKYMRRTVQSLGQTAFEREYGHDKFMKVFGKNYRVNFNEEEKYSE